MTDTDKLIARAEALSSNAMPGPWCVPDRKAIEPLICTNEDEPWNVATAHMCCGYPDSYTEGNAQFIAASRQLVPDLIAALRAEKEARERAEAALGLILAQLDNSGLESGSGGPVGERVALRIEEIAVNAMKGGAK